MIKTYNDIVPNKDEALRYLGYPKGKADETVLKLADECINELKLTPKVCFETVSVKKDGENLDFELFHTKSKSLSCFIGEKKSAVLFGATIGIEFDRLLKKVSVISPAKAAVLQAVGASSIEALCDKFCDDLGGGARFSPGYGDFPLEAQKDFVNALSLSKNIGVCLTSSLLMTPTKSVTAIFVPNSDESYGCENCDKKCEFRRK